MAKDYVYLIANRDVANRYKIGVTNNLSTRLSSLRAASGCHLELVASQLCVNAYRVESYLHNAYKAHRRNGEWFDFNAELLNEVTNLYSNTRLDNLTGEPFATNTAKRSGIFTSPLISPHRQLLMWLPYYYGVRHKLLASYPDTFNPIEVSELHSYMEQLNDKKLAICKRRGRTNKEKLLAIQGIHRKYPLSVSNGISYYDVIDHDQYCLLFGTGVYKDVHVITLMGCIELFIIDSVLRAVPGELLHSAKCFGKTVF